MLHWLLKIQININIMKLKDLKRPLMVVGLKSVEDEFNNSNSMFPDWVNPHMLLINYKSTKPFDRLSTGRLTHTSLRDDPNSSGTRTLLETTLRRLTAESEEPFMITNFLPYFTA